jgi:hypothetical protein
MSLTSKTVNVANFQVHPLPVLHASELSCFPRVGDLRLLFTEASAEPSCFPLANTHVAKSSSQQ